MKPHLPLVLLSALIFSHSSALAADFVKDGTSTETLAETTIFDTMKIGTVANGGNNDAGLAGTLNIAASVTTTSFQGATAANARYTLNLEDGGSLIVTGASSDKANASMILAIKGYGETTRPTTEVTTFNMNGGELKVEKATMFFADDGHVTWNMKGGKATLLGLDMTSGGSKTTKLALTGGEIAIGANGLTADNSDKNTIELGNGTLAAYESWTNASTANMSLTNAVEGTKIKVAADASMELAGVISDKAGVAGKLVKQGEGHLTLSGANTYSGETLVEAGTLTLTNLTGYRGAITAQGGITNLTNLTGYTGTINAQGGITNLTNLTGYTGTINAQGGTINLTAGANNIYDLANVSGTGGTLRLESGTFSIGGTEIGTANLGGATLTANGGAILLIDIFGKESDTISFTGALTGTLNIDFNIAGASMGDQFTIMTTDSEANALASINSLSGDSQFYKGTFTNNGVNIQYNLTGYSDDLLQWNGGHEGTWSTGSTSWLANGAAATFDSDKSVLFGDHEGTDSATITIAEEGIATKGVMIEANNTHYTFNGGSLETTVFVKNGDSVATLNLDYKISKLQINGGELELKRAPSQFLTIAGGGALNVNWEGTDPSDVSLSGHAGALTLTKGGIRTNLSELANESSISMKGGQIYLTDTGDNIDLALKSLSVFKTGSEINREKAGNITWKTTLTGDGTLTLNLDGTLNLGNDSNLSAFEGTLAVNGNITVKGEQAISFKPGAGLTLGEGKELYMDWNSKIEGSGILTLSKNTVVKMGNSTLTTSQIVLAAAGGNVTFSGFTWGDSNLNGKITGTANNLIFNHGTDGNTLKHSNWADSNYIGTTIFKGTNGKDSNHNYQVAVTSTGVITPWGDAGNLVQIGSAEETSSVNVKFSELNSSNSVSIGNNIELITGTGANKNSTLEFTSGSYDLTGKVSIINGANGANKAIIKSSGANITLSGGLSGAGPLDVDMATGKTLLLSGASDYTGTLSVVNGILSLGTDFATGSIQVNANGILTASGDRSISNLTLNGGAINLAGENNLSIKSLVDNSATKGSITVADTSSVTFTNDLSDLSVDNKITGTGSVKIAAGADKTVSLTGANDYSGKTQITSGTAKAGNASSFGTSAISVSGGKLDANNQNLANTINIASGTISKLGSDTARKAITITATTDSAIEIDKSFVSVENMNTAANQKITLGNGSDMLVTGNSTFVVSSENISTSFAEKGACLFSVSSDSALVINGTLNLTFTSDAFAAYTENGASLSINLFALLAAGSKLDLTGLDTIILKFGNTQTDWLTLSKDTQSEIFKNLASTGSIDLSFTGVPPIGPITPGEAIPEPSSTGLALLGAAGLLLRRRRRQAV